MGRTLRSGLFRKVALCRAFLRLLAQSEVCNYCRGKRCHFASEGGERAQSYFACRIFRRTITLSLSVRRSVGSSAAESPYLWATKLGGKRKKVSVSSRLCHRVRLISCPALYVEGMSSEYSHLNQKYVSSMTTWGTILFMGVSYSAPCRFCKKQMLN